jgi:hypothetical protein
MDAGRRRSYHIDEESCVVISQASIVYRRHPSDLVNEAIKEYWKDKLADKPS